MDITEDDYRKLNSLRDQLRHRLRIEQDKLDAATPDDESDRMAHAKSAIAIEETRTMVGEAYRAHDVLRLKALLNVFSLEERNHFRIRSSFNIAQKYSSRETQENFNREHMTAYFQGIGLIALMTNGDRRSRRWTQQQKDEALAFIMDNVEHERTIRKIMLRHDTMELEDLRELLTDAKAGHSALSDGVL